jgi:hypothetical protein
MLLVKPCVVLSRQPSDEEKEGNMIEMSQDMQDEDQSDDAINEGGSMTEESELMEGGDRD